MPIAKVQLPDGRIGKFEVPEGTTEEQVLEFARQGLPAQQPQPSEQPIEQPQAGAPQQEAIEVAPVQPQATPQIPVLNKNGMSQRQLDAATELERRGKVKFSDVFDMNRERIGSGLAESIIEPVKTIASGAISDPASGFAAIRTLLATGDIDQAAKVVKQFQEQFTKMPETEAGKKSLQAIGEVIKPIAEPIGKAVKATGEFAADITGIPEVGAITETAIRMIPELLGLKITKAAKIRALNKTIGGKIEGLYDELGKIKPEIQKGLDDAGISVDDLKSVMPEAPRVEDAMKGTAEEIGEAAKSRADTKATKIAEEAKPDAEILKAAEELGVGDKLLPSHSAQNPVYVALEQGLKSIPGSQLAGKEKLLISELGKKADDLITEFGGEIDKASLSDKFKMQARELTEGIGKKESELFDEISDNIPRNFSVRTDNIMRRLDDEIAELGGKKFLEPEEKKLYLALSKKSKPTYARLDKYRKQIGRGLKNDGVFKKSEHGFLKRIYKALAKDQLAFAKTQGYDELYKTANSLTVQRKGIEDQLTKVLGKELTGAVSAKGRTAILGLQKGDTKLFDDLAKNIPGELGKETRKSIFATALNDAFVQGSRAERSLNIPGFDDFMVGLNRNSSAKKRLVKEIGQPAMKRIETLHKVVGGIRKAQKEAITTGRIAAVPKMFDEVDNLASKLYGVGKAASLAKGAIVGTIETAINAKRTPRSVAADELLASAKFQEMIKKKASKALDTNEKIKRADEIVQNLKEYKKWANTVPPRDLKDVATVGVIGYLTDKQDKGKN